MPVSGMGRERRRVWTFTLTIFPEPAFSDHAPVADDTDAGKLQVLLAELDQLPQKLSSLVQERLSAGEVDLFHS